MKTAFSAYWSDKLKAALVDRCKAPFPMSLTCQGEISAVFDAVNQGIDSHLQACFVPDRGDEFRKGSRTITAQTDCPGFWKAGDEVVIARTLECIVSPESLPVLIRRLMESGDESGESLASSICGCLGIELI